MFAMWIAAKYAKAYYQSTKVGTTPREDHPHKAKSAHIPVLHEFLSRDIYDSLTKQWVSEPHRIVRRTSKYVFVEQPYSPEDPRGSWLEGDNPTYRLDRLALEQQGYAFIPATAILTYQKEPLFFISERYTRQGSQVPPCLKVLHLSWPCTATEVHEAYWKFVRSAHPDGGCSHEKFIELQAAYEQALRLCS